MAVYTKRILSGSTGGKAIAITATATPGTLVHTGSSNAAAIEEIWLYAINYDTSIRTVTIEYGGTAAENKIIVQVDPYVGMILLVPGTVLAGNSTPLVVRAFADTASKVAILGYVNEIL